MTGPGGDDTLSLVIGCTVEAVDDYRIDARESDIIVTCTPAHAPVLSRADVREGTFIAAVGADSEDKQELEPALLASSSTGTALEDVAVASLVYERALQVGAGSEISLTS